MRAVNLLPPDHRGSQRGSTLAPVVRRPLLPIAIIVAVLVAAGLAFVAHSTSSTVSHRRATVQQLDEQLAKLMAAQQAAQPNAATATSRVSAATTIAGQRTSWDGFLGSLSRVVPEDVWLLSLAASGTAGTPTPAPAAGAAAPTGVTFTGYTYSQPSVARMMRRLELVPWLQNVSLVSSTKTSMANQTVYQFTLGANFVGLPEVGT